MENSSLEKVLYSELLPHEFLERLQKRPIAYLPMGSLEWHGDHLPLGSDALISEGFLTACARAFGGIVLPALYFGPDRARCMDDGTMQYGMDYASTTVPHRQLPGSCYWIPPGLAVQFIDAILEQLKRAGFKAVLADGHGPWRWSWEEHLKEREERFGLKLLGVTDEVKAQWQSQTDHAGQNESSLVMTLRPELVDLSLLPPDRAVWPQGVHGDDPRDSTASFGQHCIESTLQLVQSMFDKAGV